MEEQKLLKLLAKPMARANLMDRLESMVPKNLAKKQRFLKLLPILTTEKFKQFFADDFLTEEEEDEIDNSFEEILDFQVGMESDGEHLLHFKDTNTKFLYEKYQQYTFSWGAYPVGYPKGQFNTKDLENPLNLVVYGVPSVYEN